MVWCQHCGKHVPGICPCDDRLLCDLCGRILEETAAGQIGKLSSREKRSRAARDAFTTLSDNLGIAEERDSVIAMAGRFFSMMVEQNFSKGRRIELVQASCLYLSCWELKIPLLLIDLASYLRVSVYGLGLVYLKLCKDLYVLEDLNDEKLVDPSIFIPQFSNSLLQGQRTQDQAFVGTATNIIASMKKDCIKTSFKPSSVCGAAFYIAALSHGINCSKTEIARIVNICEATLTKNTESGSLNVEELTEGEREMHERSVTTRLNSNKEAVLCMHRECKPFSYGLCESCYNDFMNVSGGLVGGSDPPAFHDGGVGSVNHEEQLNSEREPDYCSVSKSENRCSEKGGDNKDGADGDAAASDESDSFSDTSDSDTDSENEFRTEPINYDALKELLDTPEI